MTQDASHQPLRLDTAGAQLAGNARHDESRDGQGNERHQRQLRRHIDQHRQETDHQQGLTQEHMETPRNGTLHLRHIVRNARKHVAFAAGGKPAHRQRKDLGKERTPDILHQPGLHAHNDALRQVAAHVGKQARPHDSPAYQQKAPDNSSVADDRRQQPAEPLRHEVDGRRKVGSGHGGRRFLVVEEHRQQRP